MSIPPSLEMTFSGSDSISDTEGSYKQLAFNEKRQFLTPQTKSLSNYTQRKAVSVGSKRSVSMSSEKAIKCKRALSYQDCSSSDSKVTMAQYAAYGITKNTKVPYMKEVKMAREDIKLILLNAFALVVDLHYEGLSLKGLFSLKNFMISTQTKRVTLQGIESTAYCKGDSILDKSTFVRMIKEMAGDELTCDIGIWLDCIEYGGHDCVLKKHINMQHSNAIFGEFYIMYHAMLEMKKNDSSRFKELLKRLDQYRKWQKREFTWCVLEDNLHYKDPHIASGTADHRDNEGNVKESVFGLVQQIRNCWAHPAQAYKHFLMAVLMCDYPCLLSDLQEALYDLGYLPHLDTEKMLSQDEQKM